MDTEKTAPPPMKSEYVKALEQAALEGQERLTAIKQALAAQEEGALRAAERDPLKGTQPPREQPPVLGVSVECLREARHAMRDAAERLKRQSARIAQLEQTAEAYRTLCVAVNIAGMAGAQSMNCYGPEGGDSTYHLERLARMIVLPGEPATATGYPPSTDSGAGSEEIHPSTSFAETGMHAVATPTHTSGFKGPGPQGWASGEMAAEATVTFTGLRTEGGPGPGGQESVTTGGLQL